MRNIRKLAQARPTMPEEQPRNSKLGETDSHGSSFSRGRPTMPEEQPRNSKLGETDSHGSSFSRGYGRRA